MVSLFKPDLRVENRKINEKLCVEYQERYQSLITGYSSISNRCQQITDPDIRRIYNISTIESFISGLKKNDQLYSRDELNIFQLIHLYTSFNRDISRGSLQETALSRESPSKISGPSSLPSKNLFEGGSKKEDIDLNQNIDRVNDRLYRYYCSISSLRSSVIGDIEELRGLLREQPPSLGGDLQDLTQDLSSLSHLIN